MPRRRPVLIDCVTYHVHCRFARGARRFAARGEGLEVQVDAVEAELRRRL